jgi:hypothetical protein
MGRKKNICRFSKIMVKMKEELGPDCSDDQGLSSIIMLENEDWITIDGYNKVSLSSAHLKNVFTFSRQVNKTFEFRDPLTQNGKIKNKS